MLSIFRRIPNNDYLLSFTAIILWHCCLAIAAYLFAVILGDQEAPGILAQTNHWDAGWLQTVINDQYRTNLASAAFYPLFPLLVGLLHALSFHTLPILLCGLIVNIIASWLALAALIKITKHLFGDQSHIPYAILLFLTFPTAFFMHVFYSEAVFCALGFWAYYWALKKQWHYVGLLLGILTASRITAILFIGLCILEYARSYQYRPRLMLRWSMLWFLLAPIGFIAYGSYLSIVQNDFWGMLSAYEHTQDWAYQQFNPNFIHTYLRAGNGSLQMLLGALPFTLSNAANLLLPVIALTTLLASAIYSLSVIKRWGIPLGITSLLGFIMFTLNNNVVSAHRYTLPLLGIYMAAAHIIRRAGTWSWLLMSTIALINVVALVSLYTFFTLGRFVG